MRLREWPLAACSSIGGGKGSYPGGCDSRHAVEGRLQPFGAVRAAVRAQAMPLSPEGVGMRCWAAILADASAVVVRLNATFNVASLTASCSPSTSRSFVPAQDIGLTFPLLSASACSKDVRFYVTNNETSLRPTACCVHQGVFSWRLLSRRGTATMTVPVATIPLCRNKK